jgi:hypothetical protein
MYFEKYRLPSRGRWDWIKQNGIPVNQIAEEWIIKDKKAGAK